MLVAQSGVICRQKCFKSPGGRGDVIKGASRQKLSINESTFFLIVRERLVNLGTLLSECWYSTIGNHVLILHFVFVDEISVIVFESTLDSRVGTVPFLDRESCDWYFAFCCAGVI